MLFWNDSPFKRAVNVAGFAVMVAAGFWWFGRPMPNVPPSVDLTFEHAMAERIPPVALGAAALALIVAVWRWQRVRKIFTEGAVVKGTVVELKTDTWQTSANVDQSHGMKKETRRSHYITFRYTVRGEERTLRRQMPNSGFTFGLKQDGPVDLMVHDSMPDKPLIRAVYLGRQ